MTDLEKLLSWLKTYPHWEGQLYTDHTEAAPVNNGVYPLGLEELERKEDVLGNVTARCRYRFTLQRMVTGQADNTAHAQWLLGLQSWVQAQCAARLAPTFGDEPAREQIRAEKGRLKDASQTGTAVYTVTITAEFIRRY